MKLIHLSDLHIGKRVNDFSMIDDQKYILSKILNIIDNESPDAIIIAGDVYDKSIPSSEAVELLDDFINSIAERKIETFIISGNHDGAERLAFASRLIATTGIHISPVYDGNITPHILNDEYGKVNIYMLPFIKPVHVRQAFPDETIESYSDAVELAVSKMNVNTDERNIILSHQFVIGARKSDSEDISVGGTDSISADLYDSFDYVALGHIHGPQHIKRETVRYSGTPLKYSFSEANHDKSVTVVELAQKGDVTIRTIPLIPKRDMVIITGKYDEIMDKSFYENLNLNDYYKIILTDEDDVIDAVSRLRTVYKNIMKLEYNNTRTTTMNFVVAADEVEKKNPVQLIDELFEMQNGARMNDCQREYIKSLVEKMQEDVL